MNRRLTTILLIAFVVAAGASYLVYRAIRESVNAGGSPKTSQVIVASRNLMIGTLLRDSDLGVAQWVGPVPKSVVTRKETIIGRGVLATLYEGEPIYENRLAMPGAGGGMAATIPPGMRACAVKVNDVAGVSGFVVPGMRVDVLITGNPPGGTATQGVQAKTILQNVEVLSAGQNIQKDSEGKPVQVQVVNLLVSPEQAEILSLASNTTQIQLVLRNPLDTSLASTSGSSVSGLFTAMKPGPVKSAPPPRKPVVAVKPPPPPPPPVVLPPAQYVIEVINGPRKEQAKFEKPVEGKQ